MDGDVEHAVSGDAAALPNDADATGLALSRPAAYQYPAYDGRAAFQYLWTPWAGHGPNARRDRGRGCYHPPPPIRSCSRHASLEHVYPCWTTQGMAFSGRRLKRFWTFYISFATRTKADGDVGRYCTHAHDQDKTDGRRRGQRRPHCSRTVLRFGLVITLSPGSLHLKRLLTEMCDTTLLLRSFPQRSWCTWCAVTAWHMPWGAA